MRFSVCIAGFRAAELTGAIASVRAQTFADWELVVVGQGADDDVRRVTLEHRLQDSRVRFEHIAQCGTSRARNQAVRSSRGEIAVFMDDDCEAAPDWLSRLADCFDEDPSVGLVGGPVIPPPPPRRRPRKCPGLRPAEAVYDPRRHQRTPPPGWDWIGCNVAIRRSVIDFAGPFDDNLGPGTSFPSCEDTDYKLRLEALGVRMRSTPVAVVYHARGWRTGVRAMLRHQRNYARGNGGMAGKLALGGDPRGAQWLAEMAALMRRQPLLWPVSVRRYLIFRGAYRECIKRFSVDGDGVLRSRPVAPSPGVAAATAGAGQGVAG